MRFLMALARRVYGRAPFGQPSFERLHRRGDRLSALTNESPQKHFRVNSVFWRTWTLVLSAKTRQPNKAFPNGCQLLLELPWAALGSSAPQKRPRHASGAQELSLRPTDRQNRTKPLSAHSKQTQGRYVSPARSVLTRSQRSAQQDARVASPGLWI